MHQTLYRKYRPKDFEEVAGGQDIIRTIKNSLDSNKMAHAYLFAGPRGIGKTTTARLIAKGLNCLTNGITSSPCNECENCKAISEGTFIDMIEIDAASNRGIDEIRNLKDRINYRPAKGRKKVYIIDEVHMLTREAFNAILKTLEEPPSHVVFILATTEPEKILPTIVSRCQRYDFKPLSSKDSIKRLKEILVGEGREAGDDTLELVYEKSEGCMRDAISILEKLISSCYGEDITIEKAQEVLGVIPSHIMDEFIDILKNSELERGMKFLDDLWEGSMNVEIFFKDLAKHIRTKILSSEVGPDEGLKMIEIVYDTLTKFKFEEDKRLLGYVILSKICVKIVKTNAKTEVIYKEVVKEVVKTDETVDIEPVKEIQVKEIDVDIDQIKRVWNEVITMARHEKITMAAFLAGATPMRLDMNTLYIGFTVENAFAKDKMEERENNEHLLKALRSVVDPNIVTSYELIGEVRRVYKEDNSSFADKVVEFFDGEII